MTSPPRPRRALVWVLAAATIGYWLWLLCLDRPLRSEVAPSGIVSLELAFADARAGTILADWQTRGVLDHATLGLRWDCGFIPLYVVFLAVTVRGLAPRWPSARGQRRVRRIGLAALACAPLDVAENLLLRSMLASAEPRGLALPTSVLAAAKFLLVLLAAAAIVGGLWHRARRRSPGPTNPPVSRES